MDLKIKKTKEKHNCPACLDDYLTETRAKCYSCNGLRPQKDEQKESIGYSS